MDPSLRFGVSEKSDRSEKGDRSRQTAIIFPMPVTLRSFAKINIGLRIGPHREDGYHELRTIYQTISLHDVVRVDVTRGAGIEIYCKDPRVPSDESNTCWPVADRLFRSLKTRGHFRMPTAKRLPLHRGP